MAKASKTKKKAKKKSAKKGKAKATGNTKTFQFRSGSGLTGGKQQAEIVAKTLGQITSRHRGKLQAEDVVTEAQRKESPLHRHFEWSNSKAAHQHRLSQARLLIRSVEVVLVEQTSEGPKEILVSRQFPNLNERDGLHGASPYRNVDEVLSNKAMTDQWVANALAEAEQWMARYNNIAALSSIHKEIEKAQKALARRETRRKKKKA